jgi:hypothetical protein
LDLLISLLSIYLIGNVIFYLTHFFNVRRLPKTSTEWTCHIEWFDAKGRSLCYGPMHVSLFQPPTRSPKGGNQPSESSMVFTIMLMIFEYLNMCFENVKVIFCRKLCEC